MKSYIKLYGPPILKAIKTLEKISIDMPEVCIMNSLIERTLYDFGTSNQLGKSKPKTKHHEESLRDDVKWVMDYFEDAGAITRDRCQNIISYSGENMGEYDFYFEWFTVPNNEQYNSLIEKIDEALEPLGCKYTITTK